MGVGPDSPLLPPGTESTSVAQSPFPADGKSELRANGAAGDVRVVECASSKTTAPSEHRSTTLLPLKTAA